MSCPYHKLKEGLPKLARRMLRLPISENSYPVPFFVKEIEGKPDFRVIDPEKLLRCIREDLCWVCGDKLGVYRSFVVGPMGYINRISSDAPMHTDCADWSVKGCPFLTNPNMKRREDEMTERGKSHVGGVLIDENPGVMCLYTTKRAGIVQQGQGLLFTLGQAESAEWYAKARIATDDELQRAFAHGAILATRHCDETERDAFTAKVRSELMLIIESRSQSASRTEARE